MFVDSKDEAMLTENDLVFIETLIDRAPYIRANFDSALSIPSEERYEWAQDRVYDIKRKRYMKRGVPEHDTESVGDHTLESIGLATLHTPDHCLRDTVERMILIHDLPQAILDNLRCEDVFSEIEKQRAEQLAAQVIFEDVPRAYALWEEYEKGETHEARVAKDIQHAQMLLKISEYERDYPKTRKHFKPYWDTLESTWVSDAGKSLHALLQEQLPDIAANDDHDDRACVA